MSYCISEVVFGLVVGDRCISVDAMNWLHI